MAQTIRYMPNTEVNNDLLRQTNLSGFSRDSDLPGVAFTPTPGKTATREERMDRQLAMLAARVGSISADLQQIDSKWGKQFAGFQETASITAEALIGFEEELEREKGNLAQFSAIFSSQAGAIVTRSNLLASALEEVVQEFSAYRGAVQTRLSRLYVGLGLLGVALLGTITFLAPKL